MKSYAPKPEDAARRENDFSRRVLDADQTQRQDMVAGILAEAAAMIQSVCPPGRELSLALTKLEEAMLWGRESIAREKATP